MAFALKHNADNPGDEVPCEGQLKSQEKCLCVWTFPIRGPKWAKDHSPGFNPGTAASAIRPEGAADRTY